LSAAGAAGVFIENRPYFSESFALALSLEFASLFEGRARLFIGLDYSMVLGGFRLRQSVGAKLVPQYFPFALLRSLKKILLTC